MFTVGLNKNHGLHTLQNNNNNKFRITITTAHCVLNRESQNVVQTQLSIISLICVDLLYLLLLD